MADGVLRWHAKTDRILDPGEDRMGFDSEIPTRIGMQCHVVASRPVGMTLPLNLIAQTQLNPPKHQPQRMAEFADCVRQHGL